MFEGRSYQQVVGTAMGSPVSVVVANLVMEDIECTGFYPPATHTDQYLVYESQHPTAHMTRAAGNGSTSGQCWVFSEKSDARVVGWSSVSALCVFIV